VNTVIPTTLGTGIKASTINTRAIAGAAALAMLLITVPAWTKKAAERPKILRIASVEILSSEPEAAKIFYGRLMGLDQPCNWCETPPTDWMFLPSGQMVKLTKMPANAPTNFIGSVTFEIDDEKEMKRFLKDGHVAFQELPGDFRNPNPYLSVVDPEGHPINFVRAQSKGKRPLRNLSLIHAGFVVKDREAMDKFYKDVLGFHVYWYGGMKEGETSWVDMQVPDGTDWIEYMLGVPADADKHLLGIMNHIALGVPNVKAAEEQLEKAGVKLTEDPKIGRDGKWQLNLYDPDQTRVELMEFTPVEKPCCSEYAGKHPGP
jgi:catechol 2,3-dioxygenase-like lactoylglutathione lyase family enzyme